MDISKDIMKKIVTVVIIERMAYEGGDVSTVSFTEMDDAVNYCLNKIGTTKNNIERVREELYEQMFYDDIDTKYYIAEANLIG